MSNFIQKLKSSSKELKNIQHLTMCAMLMALTIVIKSFSIQIGNYIKIGFSFIASDLAYMLFGPVVGACYGGISDILAFIIKPTGAYFFGFTFNSILAGFIYGMILYKKPIRFGRILFAKGLVTIVVNLLLQTYWLSMLYGDGFMVLFPARAIKNIIMLPINSILFYSVAKMLERIKLIQSHGVKARG